MRKRQAKKNAKKMAIALEVALRAIIDGYKARLKRGRDCGAPVVFTHGPCVDRPVRGTPLLGAVIHDLKQLDQNKP